MDQTLEASKKLLDDAESNYKKKGFEKNKEDSLSRILRYYLDGNDLSGINELKQVSPDLNDSSDDEKNTKEDNNKIEEVESSDDEQETKGKGKSDDKNKDSHATLGDKVIGLWNKRKGKLSHDVAIAGWLLSPDPVVMIDAKSKTVDHVTAMENLLKKWLKIKVIH